MTELTVNNVESLEGELVTNKIQNNQFFFSIQKMINKVGVKKYQEINKILLLSCSPEQIIQLNKEKDELVKLIRHAISKNPYENKTIEELYGDSKTDFIKGVLSKGEEFVTKFVTFDEDTHKSIDYNISNELFGYCIPYEMDIDNKEDTKIFERMQRQIEEAELFLEELDKCEELSDSYKEKMKTGVNYLIECGNKLIKGEIDKDFDTEALKSNLFILGKLENFSQPIFYKLDLNQGMAHHGWINLTKDYIRQKSSQEFIEKFNFKELMKTFDSKYIVEQENNNIELLRNLSSEFDSKFENIFKSGQQISNGTKLKSNKPK